MKSILISDKAYRGNTLRFNEKLNEALVSIEEEGGIIREKKYICKTARDSDTELWHNVIIFYDIIPTRKVLIEKQR